MKGYRRCIFIFIVLIVTLILGTSVYAYNDLDTNHWAYKAVSLMEERGIIHGYPDGNFYPLKNVTREEFAKIVVNTLNLTEREVNIKYEDIKEDRWSKEYIDIGGKYFTAYKQGDKYLFKPEESSVREDVIVTTVLALKMEDEKYDLDILNQFSDRNTITPSLEKYIAIAVKNDLIHGNADGTLKPKGNLTRAEVAQFMYNILVKKEDGELVKVPIVEEIDLYEEVSKGQVKQFSKKLKKGQNFTISVNGNKIKGNMWKDGSLFELYPYYDGKEFTEQFEISNSKSNTTMYGAIQSAKLFGFEIEEKDNEIRFVYHMDNKKYYADSKVTNNHVQTEVLQNFICFILNNDEHVKVKIEEILLDLEDIIKDYDESYSKKIHSQYPFPSTILFTTKKEIKTIHMEITNSKGIVVGSSTNKAPEHGIWMNVAIKPGETYDVVFSDIKDVEGNKYKDFEYSFTTQGSKPPRTTEEFDIEINLLRDKNGLLEFVDVGIIGELEDAHCIEIIAYANEGHKAYISTYTNRAELISMLDNSYKEGEKVKVDVNIITYANGEDKIDKVISKEFYIDLKDDPNEKKEVLVENINIKYSNLNISLAEENAKLEAEIIPSDATNKEIRWTSSDPTIATIDENGKITAKAVGNVMITATSSNGKGDTMPLTIYALRYDSKELEVGQTERIVHGADKLKEFKSSNTKVATVDQKGNVTAVSAGEAKITFKDNNNKELELPITVKNVEVAVTSVKIGFSNLNMSLAKTKKFEVQITPNDATNKEIKWTSSDPTIATVDEEGNVVPKAVGKTTITATSSNGKKSSCELTIYTLKYESTILKAGATECIVHGADKLKEFKSSNTKVATVDQKGNVTAVSGGEAVIACKDNNNKEIKCVITVEDYNSFIEPIVLEMEPDKYEFEIKDTMKLSVKSGTLQGSEVIIWEFGLEGKEIATNSGYSMKISKLIDIASKRYTGSIYNKEITLKAFPRDVRDNSDRETTIFKFIILEPVVLEMTSNKLELTKDDVINIGIKSGSLMKSEAIVWEFELDNKIIATNSGYNMKVSLLLDIAKKRYSGELYNKEITMRVWPRDVRDNSDRDINEFKIKLIEK